MSGIVSAIIITVSGGYFIYQAYVLYRECTVEAARKLMFGSFVYLPLVQLAVMIGK
jgi:heme o synthase